MYLFSKLIQLNGQRVMNYAGVSKAPIQTTSVCTHTDVSWVWAQPVTRKQRPAASVTSRSVPSVSLSVADVKKPVGPQWLGRKKSQWANGPMLTQINGPFQISVGHGIKCVGHQWVSISKPV